MEYHTGANLANFEFCRDRGMAIKGIGVMVDFRCNLACDGCDIGSNLRISDDYKLSDRLAWIDLLADRMDEFNLFINDYSIIGGEPFVDPDQLIILARHIRSRNPLSCFNLSSNGMLINRGKHILSELASLGVDITITVHDDSDFVMKKIALGIHDLKNNGVTFGVKGMPFPVYNPKGTKYFWKVNHPLDSEGKMHPAKESNYKQSWAACTEKFCTQLYEGAIWKCPYLSYLRHKLTMTGQLDDPEWQYYLTYKPLDLRTCSYDDLITFLSTGPETFCSMCPKTINHVMRKNIHPRNKNNVAH